MKWYQVTFPNTLYYQRDTEKLIFKFKNLFRAFQCPHGFCLYKTNFRNTTIHEYFISSPDKYDYFLKIPLSMLEVTPTTEPQDKSNLELVAGSVFHNESDEH